MRDAYFHNKPSEELHTYCFIEWNFESPEQATESEDIYSIKNKMRNRHLPKYFTKKIDVQLKKGCRCLQLSIPYCLDQCLHEFIRH